MNADEHNSLGAQYQVQGFPTIKIFGSNKNKPTDYQGQRTAKGIADAGVKAAREMVEAKLGGGSQKKSGSDAEVVELTDDNFDKLVLNSDDVWLVEFYAPWCGHCKNLAPQWAQAARELKGKNVKLGALDATVHQSKAGQYGIKGYPTIKYFPAGSRSASSVEDYDGGRTASDIVNWASAKVVANIPAPEIKELTSSDVLQSNCAGHPLCVVAVLPHILDCQSECRNDYLKTLAAIGDKFKQKSWGYVFPI